MSKKYVIDLPDDAQYILINGASENHCYTRVEQVDDLEELNSDYINEHYGELQDEAYKQGYAEAERIWRAPSSDNEFYQKGFEDGKNSIDMGCEGCRYSLRFAKDEPCKSCSNCYKSKYEPMPKEDDRIEVGDEVRFLPNDRKGIVTACHVPDVYAENDKYAVFCGTTVEYVLRQHITKTGKHYDIQSILEAMRK